MAADKTPSTGDWPAWATHVLSELSRHDTENKAQEKRIIDLSIQVAVLKAKVYIISSLIAGAASAVVTYLFHLLGHRGTP